MISRQGYLEQLAVHKDKPIIKAVSYTHLDVYKRQLRYRRR